MKNYILILVLAILFVSCKKEEKQVEPVIEKALEEVVKNTVFSGDFLAVGDSAIMTVGNETYKVIINDLCKELIEKSKTFQNTEYDFVNVVVKGEVSDNPNTNEWKKIIQISSIESVSKSKTEENITVVK